MVPGIIFAGGALNGMFGGALQGAGGQIKNILSKFLWGFFIFVIVGLIVFWVYKSYKNKTTYTTPVTLTILTDNGMEKNRYDLKGGLFWNKGIRDFKIKAPKKNKPHVLGYVPDMSKSNCIDGRLHFITYGDQTIWQQVESGWHMRKEGVDGDGKIFQYNLIESPIPRETKQIAINSIKNWRDTVEKAKITVFGIAIGAFIVMVIAHLISLYIQTRLKCGVPA
jgi:hypothetical protein